MSIYDAERTYALLYDEETNASTGANYGAKPTTPNFIYAPVDDFGIRPTPERRQSQARFGTRGRNIITTSRSTCGGTIGGQLSAVTWASDGITLAEFLVGWMFGGLGDLHPKSLGAEYAQGAAQREQYNGLVAQSATLSSTENGIVTYQANAVGKNRVALGAMSESPPSDLKGFPAFEHCDTTLVIDGTAVNPKSWQLQRTRQLSVNANTSCSVSSITNHGETVTFACVLDKASNDYVAHIAAKGEEEVPITLTFKGLIEAGGTDFRLATVTIPRASFQNVPISEPFGQIATQNPTFDLLRDGSDDEYSIAWTTPT